jgi:DNA-directed RNA polymerase specialized sigma24 family protein
MTAQDAERGSVMLERTGHAETTTVEHSAYHAAKDKEHKYRKAAIEQQFSRGTYYSAEKLNQLYRQWSRGIIADREFQTHLFFHAKYVFDFLRIRMRSPGTGRMEIVHINPVKLRELDLVHSVLHKFIFGIGETGRVKNVLDLARRKFDGNNFRAWFNQALALEVNTAERNARKRVWVRLGFESENAIDRATGETYTQEGTELDVHEHGYDFDLADAVELHIHLAQGRLNQLPDSLFISWMLRLEGFTQAEAAEELGISVTTVKRRWTEAAEILRGAMAQRGARMQSGARAA